MTGVGRNVLVQGHGLGVNDRNDLASFDLDGHVHEDKFLPRRFEQIDMTRKVIFDMTYESQS